MDPTKPQTQGELIRSTYEIAVRVEAQAKATNGRVTRLERAYLVLGGALATIFARELAPLIVRAFGG
jgi:hypothetical protein